MSERDDIIRRIKQLRERTTKRGCTEAEAVAAAQKAAALMAQSGLSDDDVDITEARVSSKVSVRSYKSTLVVGISRATNTASLHIRSGGSSEWLFVGLEPGPEIAVYLLEVCERAIDRALREFKKGTFYKRRRSISTRKEAAADFCDAMSRRLIIRMIDLFLETESAEKRDRAESALAARYDFSVVNQKPRQPKYDQAWSAGRTAGEKVPLHRGVSEAHGPKLIGGR